MLEAAGLPDAPEASGLAVSRRHPGVVWVHNDSGNAPVLVAVDQSGTVQARVRIPIRLRDWEDIAAAPCPTGGGCLYVGDIGDNRLDRPRIQVYRVAEPGLGDVETGRPEAVSVAYPDGPHNAEAMFVAGMDLFIVTKDPVGGVYRAPLPAGAGEITLERIGQLRLARVTDAEAAPDGRTVAVRTPDDVVIYRTADLAAGGTPPPAFRTSVEALQEPQGEGVALGADGLVYLASEGRLWERRGQLSALRCTIPE